MASTPLNAPVTERATLAALEERAKLQRHFGRFDMLFFLVCTLVGLDTIGTVAKNGAQGFTWLIFLGIVFFFPYAFLMSELGTAFPEEGGPYIWTRLAFGRLAGGFNAVLYWISNPIWVGGSLGITALTAFETFFNGGHEMPQWARYLFVLAFIWFTVWSAIISFRIGKYIPTAGAWCRIIVLGFFTISVVLYAIKHGLHGFSAGSFSPSYSIFIAVVPVLFFNYVGFELPSAAGEEMTDPQRDVPFAVLRSAIGAVLLYGGPILAILLVLPTSAITSLGGFLDAIKTVFTVYGGHVDSKGVATLTGFGQVLGYLGAIAFIFALITSGSTWIMGADRTLAVAAYDGSGPRLLGRFSARFGTPIYVNILSGIVSTIVMVMAFTITSGNAGKYFTVVLGLAISTTTLAYILIFPSLIKLRYSHAEVARPYRIPGGNAVVWGIGVLTTAWAVLASVALLWPGFGTSSPDSALPSGFTRGQFEASQIIPLLVIAAMAFIFYLLGRPTRQQLADESLIQPTPAARDGGVVSPVVG